MKKRKMKIYLGIITVLYMILFVTLLAMNIVIGKPGETFNPPDFYWVIALLSFLFMGAMISGYFMYFMFYKSLSSEIVKGKEEK